VLKEQRASKKGIQKLSGPSGWLAISISVDPDFQLQNHHTDFDKIWYDTEGTNS
jgi:hypothetical protein